MDINPKPDNETTRAKIDLEALSPNSFSAPGTSTSSQSVTVHNTLILYATKLRHFPSVHITPSGNPYRQGYQPGKEDSSPWLLSGKPGQLRSHGKFHVTAAKSVLNQWILAQLEHYPIWFTNDSHNSLTHKIHGASLEMFIHERVVGLEEH